MPIPVALATASAAVGIAQGVAGFFTSFSARKRRRAEARRRKAMAIKSENLLLGTAKNVEQDITKQGAFLNQAYGMQQKEGRQAFGIQMDQSMSAQGLTGLAGSGSAIQATDYLQNQYASSQEQSALQFNENRYQLAQQRESRMRDIQGSLIELSSYSGNNLNVLSTYGIGGSNVV